MNSRYLLLLITLCFGLNISAQKFANSKYYLVDSLDLNELDFSDSMVIEKALVIYHSNDADTTRIQAINNIVEEMKSPKWELYNDLHFILARDALKNKNELSSAEIANYRIQLGVAINNKGYACNRDGDTWNAISYFKESLKFYRLAGDSASVSRGFIALSSAYHNVGEIELSNQMDQKAIEIANNSNDLEVLSVAHKNLAMKLMMNSYLDEALENALQSLKYSDLMPEDKVTRCRATLGVAQVYSNLGEDSLSAIYFTEALNLGKENTGLGTYLGVLASYGEASKRRLYKLGDEGKDISWLKDSTLGIFNEVLKLSIESNFTVSQIRAHTNLGDLYLSFGEKHKALLHADAAYNKSLKLSNFPKRRSSTLIRYRVLREMGRYKEALEMFIEFNDVEEQMDNSESLQIATQNKMKLIYSVEAAKDSMAFAATNALAQKEIENQNDRIAADYKQKWILYSGLGLIALFSFFLFKKFKQTQHQNKLIQNQKAQIIEAHSEVRASIEYAKRLQGAILAPIEDIRAAFNDCFVLFQPKDIVSGDFYWFEEYEKHIYIAAADCTGHGVPGAMVSVVCSNALHRSLNEFKLTDPSQILDKTRELVIDTFAKSGEDVKDGMDISLCKIDEKRENLTYCGANNPLWMLRKGGTEMEEIKADKQPIGLYEGMKPFISHQLKVQSGDQIFLFTDGYADQFGGERGKKMKYKPFKNFIIANANQKMQEQKILLTENLRSWQGDHEQIDDICIIGIKF